MKRSEAREAAMIILYQYYLLDDDPKVLIDDHLSVPNKFVEELVLNTIEKQEELNKLIDENLVDWKMSRLGKTDQAILSLAVYELLYTETPEIVCINEALELAKKYSDDKVVGIINKVLDRIYKTK